MIPISFSKDLMTKIKRYFVRESASLITGKSEIKVSKKPITRLAKNTVDHVQLQAKFAVVQ